MDRCRYAKGHRANKPSASHDSIAFSVLILSMNFGACGGQGRYGHVWVSKCVTDRERLGDLVEMMAKIRIEGASTVA